MTAQSIQGDRVVSSVSWDPEPVQRSIREAVDTLLDGAKPVACIAVQLLGESSKATPAGAACAPVIDMSTRVVAPVVIPASFDALKPGCHRATDASVSAIHTASVWSLSRDPSSCGARDTRE